MREDHRSVLPSFPSISKRLMKILSTRRSPHLPHLLLIRQTSSNTHLQHPSTTSRGTPNNYLNSRTNLYTSRDLRSSLFHPHAQVRFPLPLITLTDGLEVGSQALHGRIILINMLRVRRREEGLLHGSIEYQAWTLDRHFSSRQLLSFGLLLPRLRRRRRRGRGRGRRRRCQ